MGSGTIGGRKRAGGRRLAGIWRSRRPSLEYRSPSLARGVETGWLAEEGDHADMLRSGLAFCTFALDRGRVLGLSGGGLMESSVASRVGLRASCFQPRPWPELKSWHC
jgi:hypothetical protein